MAINWYPGHMHKANKEMKEILPDVDLIVELLDCRLPYSSQNPAIARLGKDKPGIKILSKSDLANPDVTAQWQAHFEQNDAVKTLPTTLQQSDKAQKLLHLCHKLVPKISKSRRNMLVMVTGIPNVGKSTLINATAGRKVAKTGNEPAITKGLQKIKISDGMMFLDTPGILWPKIHNENSGYRLAASGAIKDTAMDVIDVAFYLSRYLLEQYPQLLLSRYELDELPSSDLEFLEIMGAKRGCLRGKGRIDLEKASSILVNEFRAGVLGPITLETPDMVAAEEIELARQREEKAASEDAKKKKGRGDRSR